MGNNNEKSERQSLKPSDKSSNDKKIKENEEKNKNKKEKEVLEKDNEKDKKVLKFEQKSKTFEKDNNKEKRSYSITEFVGKKQIKDYELNIYVYSNQGVENSIKNLLNDFKNQNPLIKCKTEIIDGKFSKENSNYLINQFKKDYKNKNFKNVVIIPITSIIEFINTLEPIDDNEYEERNILNHFNKGLIQDQQPFFLFIDYDERDFLKEIFIVEKEFVFVRFYRGQRLGLDLEINLEIKIKKEDTNKINILKNILLKRKKNFDDFELIINEINIYQILYGDEIIELESFLEIFNDPTISVFNISLTLINQNSDFLEELAEYEKIENEIIKVKFYYYSLKKEVLNKLLSFYSVLDPRNFKIKRNRKNQKYQLYKYASFYNNFDDILYCDQLSFYPYKINIGVGGFSGSGKSALINAILGEKRCLESQVSSSIKNTTLEYTLKDYAINFIEFTGFDVKKDILENKVHFDESIVVKMLKSLRQKERIHCFLFCIKYDDILPEKDEVIKEIFDKLVKFRIKIFFVITQSEKPDSEGFKLFKGKIMNFVEKAKKVLPKNLIDYTFGENIDKDIIPIFAFKKKFQGQLLKPFGLDELFLAIFDYFMPKVIKYDDLLENEDKDAEIKKLIDNKELLYIFRSKEDLKKAFRNKMESDASKFILKFFMINQNYLNSITIEKLYEIYDYVFDHFLIIYKLHIDKLSIEEKLKMYKISTKKRIESDKLKEILENKELEEIKKGNIEIKELINSPLLHLFSSNLSKLIVDQFWKIIIENNFLDFFKEILRDYNNAILDLFELSVYYKSLYLENAGK